MNIRIYIGKNVDLPRVDSSFAYIQTCLNLNGFDTSSVQVIESSSDKFEYPALDKCWVDSQTSEFYGLYLHCKGASKVNETEFMNGLAWLRYMLYGVVCHSEVCIAHMDKGADLVGSMWYRHFKGNCFWFKSSYVRGLIRPNALNTADRYIAEYWCSQAYWFNQGIALPRVKNLFYLPIEKDADFLALSETGYNPELSHITYCSDLTSLVANPDYSVFDELVITKEEHDRYAGEIFKYMNYDASIVVKN